MAVAWVRIVLGLLAAAAVGSAPLWWQAAGALVRAGPLAPAWPWLLPGMLAAAVVAVTLLAPRPARRRRGVRNERRQAAHANTAAGAASDAAAAETSAAARRVAASAGPVVPHGSRAPHTAAAADPVEPEATAMPRAVSAPPDPVAPAVSIAPGTAPAPAPRRSAAAPAPARGRQPRQTRRTADPAPGAEVTVYEAEAFARAVRRARESVALEGGVYRVRERLYGARAEARPSLRRIAEGVITDDKIALLETAGRRREVRMQVTGDGLSYDHVLAQYPDPESDATRVRALDEQRVLLQADAALLLAGSTDSYAAVVAAGAAYASGADRGAGAPAPAPVNLTVSAGDALYDDYLRARRYLVAGPGAAVMAALPFAAERVALLPAVLAGARAYLLFASGAPRAATADEGVPWRLHSLIEQLNLHP